MNMIDDFFSSIIPIVFMKKYLEKRFGKKTKIVASTAAVVHLVNMANYKHIEKNCMNNLKLDILRVNR